MSSPLKFVQLTRAAAVLNAAAGGRLPALILVTDDVRLKAPLAAAKALPKGSTIILRHRENAERYNLAIMLAPIARARGLRLLIAGDPALAGRVKASGVHFPETRVGEAGLIKTLRPHWLVTAAAHSLSGLRIAKAARADAALLAPVFATQSHKGKPHLGPARARLIARASPLPVYALGGIEAQRVAALRGGNFAGIAAVGAFMRVLPVAAT